jgi:hypothetical protein
MAKPRRTRKQKNRDENLAIIIGASAIVVTVEHWWGYVLLAACATVAAYLGLRLRRRQQERPEPAPAPRMAKPKRGATTRLSSECAGGDHDACFDRVCTCPHPHTGRKAKVPAATASPAFPYPADDIPPF